MTGISYVPPVSDVGWTVEKLDHIPMDNLAAETPRHSADAVQWMMPQHCELKIHSLLE